MKEFRRCLRKEALMTLEALARANEMNWWKELLQLWAPSGDGPGLRLAIRENTIDFYRHGNRVAHVGFGQGKKDEPAPAHLETHIKYLRGEDAGDSMVKLKRASDLWTWSDGGPTISFDKIIANIDMRMDALRDGQYRRKGLEKKGVDAIAGANAAVIDLEMGLPRDPGLAKEDDGAPRIDLVALEQSGEEIRIVFWEAKTFDDSRLRVDNDAKDSEVIKQLRQYGDYLADTSCQKAIVDAYRETCRLLTIISQQSDENKAMHPLVIAAADKDSKLSVDLKPRLLIFGLKSGKCSEEDLSWVRHREKIERSGIPIMVASEAAGIKLPDDAPAAFLPA
jgi:hypothetical protein